MPFSIAIALSLLLKVHFLQEYFLMGVFITTAFLVTQMAKNSPAMRETWVQSLGWEDPLEEGRATHSSILAWRVPWTEERGRL